MKRILSKQIAMLAVLMMVFAFAGCSDDDDDNPTGNGGGPTDQVSVVTTAGDTYFDDYNTIDGMGVNLPAATFFANYTPDTPNMFVVDLRSATDYANAHIIGAVNWSINDVMANFDTLPTDQTIVFTCYSGQTASYATAIVNVIGTETGHNAQNLLFGASGILPQTMVKADGSYNYYLSDDIYQNGGFVTTAAPAKPAAGDYPTVMTEAETAEAVLLERAAAVIGDWGAGEATMARTDAVAFDEATQMIINYWSPSKYANGHLAGAYQYTPEVDILTTGALNTLPLDKEIGIYCWTGQTSAQLTAYLRMVGYDAQSITYGTNGMAAGIADLSHTFTPADDSYLSIFEGTGIVAK